MAWTLTKQLQKQIDGYYTRMLRMALTLTGTQNVTNKELYQNLSRVTEMIQQWRMRIVRYCLPHAQKWHQNLSYDSLERRATRERKQMNHVDNLLHDSWLENKAKLNSSMANWYGCRYRVQTLMRPGRQPQ